MSIVPIRFRFALAKLPPPKPDWDPFDGPHPCPAYALYDVVAEAMCRVFEGDGRPWDYAAVYAFGRRPGFEPDRVWLTWDGVRVYRDGASICVEPGQRGAPAPAAPPRRVDSGANTGPLETWPSDL